MANFCTNCGAAVNAGTPFCTQCGSRVSTAAAPPVQPSPVPPPAAAQAPLPPASSSPVLKIILFVVLGLFVLGALGVAGLIYAGYKVKNRVERVAKEYGVDSSAPRGPSARRVDVCSLITRDEAAEIMGVPVERIEPSGTSECRYIGKAPTDEERQKQIDDLQEKLKDAKGKEPDMRALEDMTKNMVGGMAGGAGRSFSVKVDWEGGHAAVAAMRLTMGVMTGDTKLTESLKGVGDEAVIGPMASILMFAKGDTAVEIDLRMLPNGKQRGIEIARKVASRLEF